eukprot:COSAG02_NODE_2849_length_7902_cov_2.924773_4_plen_99_part_00
MLWVCENLCCVFKQVLKRGKGRGLYGMYVFLNGPYVFARARSARARGRFGRARGWFGSVPMIWVDPLSVQSHFECVCARQGRRGASTALDPTTAGVDR